MSDIVVSPLLKMILGKLNSLQVDERTTSNYNLQGRHVLKHIVSALQTIAPVANNAEKKANMDGIVSNWMQVIRDVLYELDDLIDEVQVDTPLMMPNKVGFFNPFQPKFKLAQAFQHILLRLNQLACQPSEVGFSEYAESTYKSQRERITGSFVDGRDVIGRGSDKEAVMSILLKSVGEADQRVTVVPIVGFIWVGKTTLAQLIFNSRSIIVNFDPMLWMSVGGCHDNFKILKMLGPHLREHHLKGDWDIEQAKTELRKLLENRRFLIVLDDFLDNDSQKSLARDLKDMGSKGSAIIMTTRSRRAASLIGTTPPYLLQPLSPDASYQLFTRYAFLPHTMIQDSQYERIGRELVKLCSGIPLLLKTIGALLITKTRYMEWASILERVQDEGIREWTGTYASFECVEFIPSHLKLPLQSLRLQKACGLSVEAVACVWMALGFLYSDDPTQSPEYIGRKYLKEFVHSSLFPDVEYAPGGVVRHIKFNDALYEFATHTPHPLWVFVRGQHRLAGFPIYIIWDQDCLRGVPLLSSQQLPYPKKVRLFMVSTGQQASVQFVRNIVSFLGRLRVLGLGGCDLDMLPDSIGQLKYLRYLDVGRNARMIRLPDSICNLWHLQTLFLHGCYQLEKLPARIGMLQNLRYLTLTILRESLPEEIGRLRSLQTLGLSSCTRLASLPSSIKNLKNLQTLAMVDCAELDLAASSSVEALKGLDAIQTLLLSRLPKLASLPSDLGNPSVALKNLLIQSCTALTETTWIAQFKFLRSLAIEDCPQLPALMLADATSQLMGLLELVIRRCPSLDNTAWIRQFVYLRSLIIDACPKLVDLDAGFSELKNLERLEIRRCPAFTNWFASPAGNAWCNSVSVRVIELDGVRLEP